MGKYENASAQAQKFLTPENTIETTLPVKISNWEEMDLSTLEALLEELQSDLSSLMDTIGIPVDDTISEDLVNIKTEIDSLSVKVGSSTDHWNAVKSVLAYCNSVYQHIHNQSYCYPTLADGIALTTPASLWTLSGFAELIPANAINTAFDIHYVNVESATATQVFEIVLYAGLAGNEIEIGRIRTHKDSAQSGATNTPIQIPAQAPNTRISAKIACDSASSRTVKISTYYHRYS